MHVVTGLGERESFRPEDYAAYYRRLRARFLDAVERRRDDLPVPGRASARSATSSSLCKQRWDEDDHLTLVAGMSRLQVERLHGGRDHDARGARRKPRPDTKVKSMRATTFQGLNHQAALQLHRRRTGEHRIDLLPLEPDRGFALLPEPSPGDIWLDLEGDPWFEPARGLEYLIGWIELGEDGEPRYEHIWAHDRDERAAGASSGSSTTSSSAAAASRGCTSTTTRRTSAPRSRGSWASTARARRRSTTSSAAKCSSTSSG